MAGRPLADGNRERSRFDELGWDELVRELGKEPKKVTITQKGKRYAALDLSYWDPVMKQGRHRRKLIGFYDENGNLVETGSEKDSRPKVLARRNTAETLIIGTDLLFSRIADETRLTDTLRKAYPKDWEKILTCAYFMLSEGKPLSQCEQWSAGTRQPYGKRLGDQRISELLAKLTTDSQKGFFTRWIKTVGLEDNYAFDITSISSYSDEIEAVRRGYNRDHENLEQINLGLMIGSDSYLPVYYTMLPGNINDRSSLNAFLKILKRMGFKGYKMVMDKGFCTKANIDLMYSMNVRFTISLTFSLNFAKNAVEEAKEALQNPDNLCRVMGSTVYRTTSLKKWTVDGKQHRCYVHVFYDRSRKDADDSKFDERLLKVKTLLYEGATLTESDGKFAERYFTKRVWGDKVEWKTNMGEVEETRSKEIGYLVVISNHEKDPEKALEIYRCKETAEQAFDDLKNTEDLYRLRVHTEGRMDGKLFVAFVSLVILMRIRSVISKFRVLENRSLSEIIGEMKLLRQTCIGNRKSPIYTARTKLQKQIIEAFGIETDFDDSSAAADDPEVDSSEIEAL